MGALKQQKEVLSGLFYTDNDLLCGKGWEKNTGKVSNCVFRSNFEHHAL